MFLCLLLFSLTLAQPFIIPGNVTLVFFSPNCSGTPVAFQANSTPKQVLRCVGSTNSSCVTISSELSFAFGCVASLPPELVSAMVYSAQALFCSVADGVSFGSLDSVCVPFVDENVSVLYSVRRACGGSNSTLNETTWDNGLCTGQASSHDSFAVGCHNHMVRSCGASAGKACSLFGDCSSCLRSDQCVWCADLHACAPVGYQCADPVSGRCSDAECFVLDSCTACLSPSLKGLCSWCSDGPVGCFPSRSNETKCSGRISKNQTNCCDGFNSCSSCTEPVNGDCAWCLDNALCGLSNVTCGRKVASPALCPNCSILHSCASCAQNSPSCGWCGQEHSCVDGASNCPVGVISDPGLCCTNQNNCKNCTEQGSCFWCLTNNVCSNVTAASCSSFVSNPSFCPSCNEETSCISCLSANLSCLWCLDSSACVSKASGCLDVIGNKNFCPKKPTIS